MVQTSHGSIVVEAVAQQLRRARDQGVDAVVADRAAVATRRALIDARGSKRQLYSRAEGYYWAVVRRTLVRRRLDRASTARFVLAAVVEDLSASGRDNEAVWNEIERGWAGRVPSGVLEEYRARLSA